MSKSSRVEESTGKSIGLGLFAARSFEQGEFIGFYSGDILTEEEVIQRYPDPEKSSAYLFNFVGGYTIDARSTRSHYTRYINDPSGLLPTATENAIFENPKTTREHAFEGCVHSRFALENSMIIVRASTDIARNQEIFASYGETYF